MAKLIKPSRGGGTMEVNHATDAIGMPRAIRPATRLRPEEFDGKHYTVDFSPRGSDDMTETMVWRGDYGYKDVETFIRESTVAHSDFSLRVHYMRDGFGRMGAISHAYAWELQHLLYTLGARLAFAMEPPVGEYDSVTDLPATIQYEIMQHPAGHRVKYVAGFCLRQEARRRQRRIMYNNGDMAYIVYDERERKDG